MDRRDIWFFMHNHTDSDFSFWLPYPTLHVLLACADSILLYTYMQAIWIRLFSEESSIDKGTLFQLKNAINRSSIPNDPKNNLKATEDFFEMVLVGYIVTAAKQMLASNKDLTLSETSDMIIDEYVRIFCGDSVVCDKVYLYGCEVITLGLLWYGYRDASREGDGDHIMLIWKFLLLVFRATKRKNYSKEAAILLVQDQILSERKVVQLRYSRFINVHGRPGCNIPADLFMEHLNRQLKSVLVNMGSNIQPESILRAARAIGVVNNICHTFEKEVSGTAISGYHPIPSYKKDLLTIITILTEAKVLQQQQQSRVHSCSKFKYKYCVLDYYNEEETISWLLQTVGSYIYSSSNCM